MTAQNNAFECKINKIKAALEGEPLLTEEWFDGSVVNTETGECKLGFYDGNFIQTIKGLLYQGKMITTRFFSWRLERTNAVCFNLEFCK